MILQNNSNNGTKAWRIHNVFDWSYGHPMRARMKYEKLKLEDAFDDDVVFRYDGELWKVEYDGVVGKIEITIGTEYPMEPPEINSIDINSHQQWMPHLRLVNIIQKEIDLRVLTNSSGQTYVSAPISTIGEHISG